MLCIAAINTSIEPTSECCQRRSHLCQYGCLKQDAGDHAAIQLPWGRGSDQAVYVDQRARERRAKSVVVSGLQPSDDVSDAVAFQRMCMLELGLDHNVSFTSVPETTTFSSQSATILVASLLLYWSRSRE